MSRTTRRLAGVAVAGVCAAAALTAPSAMADNGNGKSRGNGQGQYVDVQLLSFNDFHGNLEAPGGSSGRLTVDHFVDKHDVDGDGKTDEVLDKTVDAGGVEYLATALAKARNGHKNTLTVAAGDLVGASPLLSAAFHDEPTIESMNLLGLDISAVGNHEFDEGYKELQRLQAGGCIDDGDGAANQNSCPDGEFAGADFQYLAANVVETATGETVLPAFAIKELNGMKIGFIGMTLEDTPNIVTASGVAGLEFKDEVETANALVPDLKAQGVNAIVVLIHQGGSPAKQTWTDPKTKTDYLVNPNYDYTCDGGGSLVPASSPILPIAAGLDSEIDMIISGHTHQPYVCEVADPAGDSRLLTSASSFGRLFTETNLKFDRASNDIVRSSVQGANLIVRRDAARDPFQTALIAKYKQLVAPIANRVIGSVTTDVTRTANAAGESQLGDLIADAQLADPSVTPTGGAEPVIAFMNPGGIRADLEAGEVTFEEAFTVQPFNNYLVSMTLTGAQIKTLLNQQWSGTNAASPKILQVSGGFAYTYSGTTLGTVTLGGAAIDNATEYRIVTNNFLSDGGDGFPVFKDGADKYFGGLDIDAFANYLEDKSPYTPGPLTRITKN